MNLGSDPGEKLSVPNTALDTGFRYCRLCRCGGAASIQLAGGGGFRGCRHWHLALWWAISYLFSRR